MNNSSLNFAAARQALLQDSPQEESSQAQDLQQPLQLQQQSVFQQLGTAINLADPTPATPVAATNTVHHQAQLGLLMENNVVQVPQTVNVAPTALMHAATPAPMSVGLDINQLRQLHQQNQNVALNVLAPSVAPEQQLHEPHNFMRSYMDQKIQQAHYESQLRQRLIASPADPLFQAPLLVDAGLLAGKVPTYATVVNAPAGQGALALPSPHELTLRDDTRRMRGGVIEPFPEKLHRLLLEVEVAGRADVISFIANGRAFAIHKPDKFFKEIVPKYFRQSRLSSFKRQLNLYGFELINTGPARGGYFHEMFVKERPEMCRRMRRVAVKVHGRQKETKQEDAPNTHALYTQSNNAVIMPVAGGEAPMLHPQGNGEQVAPDDLPHQVAFGAA